MNESICQSSEADILVRWGRGQEVFPERLVQASASALPGPARASPARAHRGPWAAACSRGSEAKGRSPSSAPGCAGQGGTPGRCPPQNLSRRDGAGEWGVGEPRFRLSHAQVSATLSRPGPAPHRGCHPRSSGPVPSPQEGGCRRPDPAASRPGRRDGGHSPRGPRRARSAPAAPQAQGPTEEAGGHGWDSEE